MQQLQIYVFGPSEEGFLDITPNTFLNISSLADIFDEDLSLAEYSLPGQLPWTDRNKRLLGFAERVENFKAGKTNHYTCNVFDNTWPEIQNGKFTIVEKIGNWTYKRGSFSFIIQGSKAMFGTKIKYKYLNSLSFGGTIKFIDYYNGFVFANGFDSRVFANSHAHGDFPTLDFFAFAPVAIENYFDTSRADWTYEFLAKDCVNYPVIDAAAGTWRFGRLSGTQALDASNQPIYNPDGTPKIIYGTTPVGSGNAGYADYRTVPFLKVKYVVKKVCEELGYTVDGDFFTSKTFDDCFIFNQYGLENYGGTNADYNRTITFNNHVPPMLIIDFLKGFFDFFNLFPTFKGTAVTLYNRNNVIKNRKVLSVNAIIDPQFDSAFQNPDTKNSDGTDVGYQLQYNWANDQLNGDRVKDLSTVTDKKLVATVPTAIYLRNLNIGRQLTTADIAYVENENLYYCVSDATNNANILWDVYSEELNYYITGDGTRTVTVNASPLCTYVEENITTGIMEKQNYVGTRQQGSYLNSRGILVNNPHNRQTGALASQTLSSNGANQAPLYGLHFFFIRQKLVQNVLVPYTTNFNRDENNIRTAPCSLAWRGVDGLASKWHAAWQDMRQNMEIVKCTYMADQKVMNDMAAANCHEIQGVMLIPYRVDRTIPMQKTMTVSLVPL